MCLPASGSCVAVPPSSPCLQRFLRRARLPRSPSGRRFLHRCRRSSAGRPCRPSRCTRGPRTTPRRSAAACAGRSRPGASPAARRITTGRSSHGRGASCRAREDRGASSSRGSRSRPPTGRQAQPAEGARALLDARRERAPPRPSEPAAERDRHSGPRRDRLPRRLGLRAPVPPARERGQAQPAPLRRPARKGRRPSGCAGRPRGPDWERRQHVGVLLPLRRRLAAVDIGDGAGDRGPGLRADGGPDLGAGALHGREEDLPEHPRPARAQRLRRPVDPPLQLQPDARPERAAPGVPLDRGLRSDPGGRERHRARAASRGVVAGDAGAVRHRRLVELHPGPGGRAEVPPLPRRPPRLDVAPDEARVLDRGPRPLRPLHARAARVQAGGPSSDLVPVAHGRLP